MKVCIVSTYPEYGSKNVGDALITNCLISALRRVRKDVKVSVIWRAASWESVRDVVLNSDVVVFACLAIRPRMTEKEYPYLNEIIASGVRYAVVAAGTSLKVGDDGPLFKGVSPSTVDALRRMDEGAIFFSSRGILTQEFCRSIGMKRVIFTGDIAFYDERFLGRKFIAPKRISRIAVSDPHHPSLYANSFDYLLSRLASVFPEADLDVLLHGVNPAIEEVVERRGMRVRPIYLDKESGLDAYDEYDIHVGYRVHGHVSALVRRKPSYLIEQDGRAADYAATIGRKISVPCYIRHTSKPFKGLLRRAFAKIDSLRKQSHLEGLAPVDILGSILVADLEDGFSRFDGIDKLLDGFCDLNIEILSGIG